jgi:hypothetical protein
MQSDMVQQAAAACGHRTPQQTITRMTDDHTSYDHMIIATCIASSLRISVHRIIV